MSPAPSGRKGRLPAGLCAAWAVARNDLALDVAQPLATSLMVAVPINFLILFVLFALSGGVAPVAVYQGAIGPEAGAMVRAMHEADTFAVQPAANWSDAQAAVAAHDAVAAVAVPQGFSAAVASGRPAALRLRLDNVNVDSAGDIRRGLDLAILQFYRRRGPGGLPLNWREVDSYSRTVGFLPFIAVSVETAALLIGGLLVGGMAAAREWERGTMKELMLAPIPAASVVAGKLAAGLTVGLGGAACVLGVLLALGVRPEYWGAVAAVVPLLMLVFVSLGLAAGSLTRSRRTVIPLAFGLGLPLFFVSGPFGPITWGVPAAVAVARLFPVAYANAVLQHAMWGYWVMDVGPGVVWAVLAAWALAAVLVSGWSYHRATSVH